jgi:hypothetical protein
MRYFITVQWCNSGKRGVFCECDGSATSKDEPFTLDEMDNYLGAFSMILNPQSLGLEEEELKQYSQWIPLEEYSYQFGIACKEGQ